jgi:hypothetical protein
MNTEKVIEEKVIELGKVSEETQGTATLGENIHQMFVGDGF